MSIRALTLDGGGLDNGGLLSGESRKARMSVLLALMLVSASMTFMQCGFINLGADASNDTHIMALLGPISIAALLLGWKSSAFLGLACGGLLYVHSRLQPLDFIEDYLIWRATLPRHVPFRKALCPVYSRLFPMSMALTSMPRWIPSGRLVATSTTSLRWMTVPWLFWSQT